MIMRHLNLERTEFVDKVKKILFSNSEILQYLRVFQIQVISYMHAKTMQNQMFEWGGVISGG